MDSIELKDFGQALPDSMSVSVVMEQTPSDHAWVDVTFKAVGVICTPGVEHKSTKLIHQKDGVSQYLFSGLNVKLHLDECEGYYHNLMSPQPGCFIVANQPDEPEEMPTPYLVSLSFDEVHSYLEGDEQVYAVEIPPELYQWSEAYILQNYIAVKKTKRKRKDWKEQAKGSIKVAGNIGSEKR
ncbi:MAG: hypothetical protein ACI9JR_003128 [Gammaproteobacteria bacterium]|jgi:hypothetical protein